MIIAECMSPTLVGFERGCLGVDCEGFVSLGSVRGDACLVNARSNLNAFPRPASAVIGTSPRVPGSTFGLTRLEANLPVGIPGKYDVESTR